MQNWTEHLNPEQRDAVTTTEGPLLIVAGAGAGKTKTLTHRIGYLIDVMGVPGSSILAITFTNKAAKEMRERVHALLGGREVRNTFAWQESHGAPFIGTFHSLGVYILREKGGVVGAAKNFSILDRDDALALVKAAMKELGVDPKQFEPGKMLSLISRVKSQHGSGKTFEHISHNQFLVSTLKRVAHAYEQKLKESQALDFDDLLVKTVELLEGHPEIRAFYRARWQYIHVDEYQDTNDVQYHLVRLLVGEKKNICVVGDSDQNIYSWRGASIANILNFEEDFPGAKVVLLEQNYRSTKTILNAANEIIGKNTMRKEKNLFTENPVGERIGLFEGYDENDEARFVGETIRGLLERGVAPGDIAILYRTNFQSRVLEEALIHRSIPYQVLGTRFFDRKEVKDALSYLRAALNPRSVIDILRTINTPTRGIGKVTVEKVLSGKIEELPASTQKKVRDFYQLLESMRMSFEHMAPSQIMKTVIQKSGLREFYLKGDDDDKERLMNIEELVTLASRYDQTEGADGLEAFLADVALQSDQDQMKEGRDAVRLMTVHAAKGLEFPYVFITGLEQDLFPSRRSQEEGQDVSQKEEERRLFYVAMTRAASKAFLSYASFRMIFGTRMINAPSEFVNDIPTHLLEHIERPRRGLLDDDLDTIVYL